ncbi:hypothetical protein CBM2589_A90946 [Cupriavidus taiwanensis]|uniref:Uncharacterized protein n=1 Tax=Cupriavidus taiwanensis TaxID=164546 RepID=A0A375CGV3_9BURK|nr:hypothetical protein CBM2589_A90946 [Cupriavidus taiwanensis]
MLAHHQVPRRPDPRGGVDPRIAAEAGAEQPQQRGAPGMHRAQAGAEQPQPYPVPELPAYTVGQRKRRAGGAVGVLNDHTERSGTAGIAAMLARSRPAHRCAAPQKAGEKPRACRGPPSRFMQVRQRTERHPVLAHAAGRTPRAQTCLHAMRPGAMTR